MSTNYLIDAFTSPVNIAPILDAIAIAPGGSTRLNGNFVVRVPDGVAVQNPVDLGDLLTQKYASLLANFAIFTQMAYDPLLDTLGLDLTVTGTQGVFGERGTVQVAPFALVQSQVVGLVGAPPSQALVTWEAFSTTTLDPVSGRLERTYTEAPAYLFDCQVSFNGGATWLPALDGAVVHIPVLDQGTNFLIQFTETSGNPTNLGSWAILY